jgi:uncharacterized protein YecE (DUF72 family)
LDSELPNLLPSEPPKYSLVLAPLRPRLAALAEQGIYLGTSSWKYPGWMGLVYSPERYVFRGEFSEGRFNDRCLKEYAETFPAVGVDATYYTFPSEKFAAGLGAQVPDGFRFGFKVTDEITAKRFPLLPRFAERQGQLNPNFLNAEMFADQFLRPLEVIRPKVGLVMFEFSRFYAPDFVRGRDFVAALDRFLGELPQGWRYGVEVRNRNLLHPDVFAMLRGHGVAHLFNQWSGGTALGFQLAQEGCWTAAHGGARLLIPPGNNYEESQQRLMPYDQLREPFPECRQATVQMIQKAKRRGIAPMFVFFGNKLEGSSVLSAKAVVEGLGERLDGVVEQRSDGVME